MLRKALIAAGVLLLLCGAALLGARWLVRHAAHGRTYSDVSLIPHRRVGLVLGCPRRVPGGWTNPFFENRINAAAQLYFERKIDFLVVSGDNHIQSYDEPVDMRNALVEKGVPKDRIYLDYAGLRTLDSVVRVKGIFLQNKITVVSQHFHNQRAIFLAGHHGIDAIGFDAPDVAMEYALKTLVREQFAKVKAVLDVYFLHTQPHFLGQKIAIGYPRAVLDPKEAPKLAEMMCAQLPNIGTFVEYHGPPPPGEPIPEPEPGDSNRYGTGPIDDASDALLRLGSHAMPCLVDHLTDTRWMPDPRSEPLLGAPLAGDVAYMLLGEIGVPDLLPALAHKPQQLRMDDYFIWPSEGDHRRKLQDAVRSWWLAHPDCCGDSTIELRAAPSQPILRMTEDQFAAARMRFARLHPGMNANEVEAIAGKPDASDVRSSGRESPGQTLRQPPGLIGYEAADHNENLAYIYFVERWADEIARRDPLRDRYVILYFSGQGTFTRMFSNVPGIPPIFPQNGEIWQKLMWGEASAQK